MGHLVSWCGSTSPGCAGHRQVWLAVLDWMSGVRGIWALLPSHISSSRSFEAFCTMAGACPTGSAMRGLATYCLVTNKLRGVERLVNHNNVSEPLVEHQRTNDRHITSHPGGLGWATYWRPAAPHVGHPTCVGPAGRSGGCERYAAAANACHVLGATIAEKHPHKPTPHGRQHYVVGGGSDGYVFVQIEPVSVDVSRRSYMSAWVHVSSSSWDSGSSTALDGLFINVWATVQLLNGSITEVYLLRTEGKGIHSMSWEQAPHHVIEDTWIQYSADLPATTQLVNMSFGADVPDKQASVWFDRIETACTCQRISLP
jgi:hypothetical protein|eukprot:COSAG01_NODE_9859_length_2319_cov_1.280631_1_plen_314_part_00